MSFAHLDDLVEALRTALGAEVRARAPESGWAGDVETAPEPWGWHLALRVRDAVGAIRAERLVRHRDHTSLDETWAVAQIRARALLATVFPLPPAETHHLSLTGGHWSEMSLALDGKPLASVFAFRYAVVAGEERPSAVIELARPRVHLDQDLLPSDIAVTVTGYDEVLALLRRVVDDRNRRFADLEYARAHSSDEETALYREIADALHRYEETSGP